MPESTILLGNGPNRLRQDTHSWEGVLKRLAEFSGQAGLLEGRNSKPFPVLFEEMALSEAIQLSEEELKEKVANWVRELRPNWLHERLLEFGGRHILTTNYDYCIERAKLGTDGIRADLEPESRYSLFRCREVGPTRVWHIHGECDQPPTLTLGYEQYVGYLYKARTYLTSTQTRPKASPVDHRSPILDSVYDFDDRAPLYSWADIFLRDNIHVVGFGYDYSEIGLWWLLSLKQRLRANHPRVTKRIRVGSTTYYYFDTGLLRTRERAHLAALRNFGVELVAVPVVNRDFQAGWQRLCQTLAGAT